MVSFVSPFDVRYWYMIPSSFKIKGRQKDLHIIFKENIQHMRQEKSHPDFIFTVGSFSTFKKTIEKSPTWDVSPGREYKPYKEPQLIAPASSSDLHNMMSLYRKEKNKENNKNLLYVKMLGIFFLIFVAAPLALSYIAYSTAISTETALQEEYSLLSIYSVLLIPVASIMILISIYLSRKFSMFSHYTKNKGTYNSIEMIDISMLKEKALNKETWVDLYDFPLAIVITRLKICNEHIGETLRDIYFFSSKDDIDTQDMDKSYDDYISTIIFMMFHVSSLSGKMLERCKEDSEAKRKILLQEVEKLNRLYMRSQEEIVQV